MKFERAVDGKLDATPLTELLTEAADEKATGVVRIDGGREIWLSDGRIYLAVATSSPKLAELLFAAGLGPIASIRLALNDRSGAGESSALDRLLEGHVGSKAIVERLIHEYNLSSLFEMLVPSDASFHYEADVRHSLGDRFSQDTAELIDKAKDRLDLWRRIASRIPSTAAAFSLSSALPTESEERLISADEWRFLSRLNGRNTVAEIITETGESAFRVCSVLYRLLLEGLIEEADDVALAAD